MKKILVLFLAIFLVSVTSCENPFLKKMLVEEEKGSESTVPNTPYAPFVEGGASLILSPDKLTIKVKAKTEDGSNIVVEGCNETELTNDTETELHAKSTTVTLKGKIIELGCRWNQLTALNVQGCTALQALFCESNQLTALDVQNCTALQTLDCWGNQLTALNVQGCTALERLWCYDNQLTTLDVQGLSALRGLRCDYNQLTALNAQGCTALKELNCGDEQLTALNVQGCTALKWLYCSHNRLTAEAFIKIFTDLPQRDAGDNARCILYTEQTGVTEGNHTDFTTPDELKTAFQNAKDEKNWKMEKVNTSGNWEGI